MDWFRTPLTSSGCTIAALLSQWLSMKVLVHSQFKDKAFGDLWATLLTKVLYKDVLFLVEILVVPLLAVQCEQAISSQNWIKN